MINIQEIIHKEVEKYVRLSEIPSFIIEDKRGVINEMGRLNKNEVYGFFPFNKFEIKIWSNDHNPPHFHAKSADGWNILVGIEDGQIIKTENIGKDSKFYKYIEDFANAWLDDKNAVFKNKTNRQVAMEMWNNYQNRNGKE